MRCFTSVLDVSPSFWMFPHIFTGVFDTNMLVSKTQVKTREKCEKISHWEKKREKIVLYCTIYALGENASHLRFSRILERLRLPKRKPNTECNIGLTRSACNSQTLEIRKYY